MEQFQFYVLIIMPILFLIIGYFSGIISIIIFLNKEFKKQATTFYFISSNVVDLTIVTCLPVFVWPSVWTLSKNSCKFFVGLMVFELEIEAWIIAFGSIDRLLTVLVPTKFEFKNKLRFKLGLILTSFFLILLLISPYISFYEEIETSDNRTTCGLVTNINQSWVIIYLKIEFSMMRVFLPFIIMLTSSFLIVYKMCSNKIRLQGEDHDFKKEYQLAIALVSMDLSFIIFRLPAIIYFGGSSNRGDVRITENFLFPVFLLIGTIPNVFVFVIFFGVNKIYRVLFKKHLQTIFYLISSFFHSFRFYRPNRVAHQAT
jgi:hypothetical protein